MTNRPAYHFLGVNVPVHILKERFIKKIRRLTLFAVPLYWPEENNDLTAWFDFDTGVADPLRKKDKRKAKVTYIIWKVQVSMINYYI